MNILILNNQKHTFSNEDIAAESFELSEALCSANELRFGSAEARTVKVRVRTSESLIDEVFDITLAGVYLGKFKVVDDKRTADRCYRDLLLADKLYDVLNADVSAWYNDLFPSDVSKHSLLEVRNSFFSYFSIAQQDVSLINDYVQIEKTIQPEQITGKTVLNAILELSGAFGRIGRDNSFEYVVLKEMGKGLYPEFVLYPGSNLFPRDAQNATKISASKYKVATYEDYETERINKLQIRQEENDIGAIVGSGDNCYIIQDNFLVYGKHADELSAIATRILDVIKAVWFVPASIEAEGNLDVRVGDGVLIETNNQTIMSYVLSRTLKGIQSLSDTYVSKSSQRQTEQVNSVNQSIIQLKGRTNVLKRTVDELTSTLTDVEEHLQSEITQTAGAISAEVTRAINAENSLTANLTITENKIMSEVVERTSLFNTDRNLVIGGTTLDIDTFNHSPDAYVGVQFGKPCIVLGDGMFFTETPYLSTHLNIGVGTYKFEFEAFVNGSAVEGVNEDATCVITIRDSASHNIIEEHTYRIDKKDDDEFVYGWRLFGDNITVDRNCDVDIVFTQINIEDAVRIAKIELVGGYENLDQAITSLTSFINQTASNITIEVNRASSAEGNLKSRIDLNDSKIEAKVSKTGGANQSFAWRLQDSGFELVSNNTTVFKCDRNGIVVNGYATATQLNALSAKIGSIESDYVSTGELNAVKATVNSIQANYVNAQQLSAVNASINSLKSSKLSTSNLSSEISALNQVTISSLFKLGDYMVRWQSMTVKNGNGQNVTIRYLGR